MIIAIPLGNSAAEVLLSAEINICKAKKLRCWEFEAMNEGKLAQLLNFLAGF